MIPLPEIQARRAQRRSWTLDEVEQDMLLDRLVVEIADDSYLAGALVLKGGTCLHKLWLPEPWRYSKDLDYERTEDAPMGPIFDKLRAAGLRAGFTQKPRTSPGKLLSHVVYRGTFFDGATMSIGIDVPTSPPAAAARSTRRKLTVQDSGYTGTADVVAVVPEEIIASKAAAIFGRMQPRDAFDVWASQKAGLVTVEDAAKCFENYHQQGWTHKRVLENFASKIDAHSYRDLLLEFGRQAPERFDIAECREAVEALIEECAKRLVVLRRAQAARTDPERTAGAEATEDPAGGQDHSHHDAGSFLQPLAGPAPEPPEVAPTADGTPGVSDSLASSTTEDPAGGQGHSHCDAGSFLQSLGVDVTASPGSAVPLPSQDEPVLVPQTRPCGAQTDDGTPCENQVLPTSTKCRAGHTPLPRAT